MRSRPRRTAVLLGGCVAALLGIADAADAPGGAGPRRPPATRTQQQQRLAESHELAQRGAYVEAAEIVQDLYRETGRAALLFVICDYLVRGQRLDDAAAACARCRWGQPSPCVPAGRLDGLIQQLEQARTGAAQSPQRPATPAVAPVTPAAAPAPPVPAVSPTGLRSAQPAAAAHAARPLALHRRWWFWSAIGAVAAGAVVGAVVGTRPANPADAIPPGQRIDLRMAFQ